MIEQVRDCGIKTDKLMVTRGGDVIFERDPELTDEDEVQMNEKKLGRSLESLKLAEFSTLGFEACFESDPVPIDVQILLGTGKAELLKRGVPKKVLPPVTPPRNMDISDDDDMVVLGARTSRQATPDADTSVDTKRMRLI